MSHSEQLIILEKFRQLTQKIHVRGFHVCRNRSWCIQLSGWKTDMPVMRVFRNDGPMDAQVVISDMGIQYPFDATEIPEGVSLASLEKMLDWLHTEADRIYEEEVKPVMYDPNATKAPAGFRGLSRPLQSMTLDPTTLTPEERKEIMTRVDTFAINNVKEENNGK